MKRLIAAIFGVTFTLSIPVSAQTVNCAPRDEVVARLQGKYGETLQSRALGRDVIVEVWANTQGDNPTGSWTITPTRVDGLMCLLASGQAYMVFNHPMLDGEPL